MARRPSPVGFAVRPITGGLNYSRPPQLIDMRETPRALNERYERGRLRKRSGFSVKYYGSDESIIWIDQAWSSGGGGESALIAISPSHGWYHDAVVLRECDCYDSDGSLRDPPWDIDPGLADFVPSIDVGSANYNFVAANGGAQYPNSTDYADIGVFSAGTSDGLWVFTYTGTASGSSYVIDYDSESGGPFEEGEGISWHDGAGTILDLIDEGTTGTIQFTLDSGNLPSDGDTITGDDSSATADVDGDPVSHGTEVEFEQIGGDAPSLARCIVIFDQRIVAGGVIGASEENYSMIQWSSKAQWDDWSTESGGGFTIIGDSPDWIQAMHRLGDSLVVYKERSIYIGRKTYLTDPPFRFDPAPGQGIGLAAPNSVGDLGEEHLFLGWDDIYVFSMKQLQPVGTRIREELYYGENGIIPQYMGLATGVIAEEFDEYWLFVATGKWPGTVDDPVVNLIDNPIFNDGEDGETAPNWGVAGPQTNTEVLYLKFDGNAEDSSVYGNDGTASGVTYVDGVAGQAASFDGVNDYVSTGLNPSYGTFSISAWVFDTGGGFSIGRYRGSWNEFGAFRFEYGGTFGYGSDDGYKKLEDTVGVSGHEWYHAVIVYNGTTLKWYLNGALSDSTEQTGTFSSIDDEEIWIGRRSSGSHTENYYNGLIDEVRIYNRALLADEIAGLYALPGEISKRAVMNVGGGGTFGPNAVDLQLVTGTSYVEGKPGGSGYDYNESLLNAEFSIVAWLSTPDDDVEYKLGLQFSDSDGDGVQYRSQLRRLLSASDGITRVVYSAICTVSSAEMVSGRVQLSSHGTRLKVHAVHLIRLDTIDEKYITGVSGEREVGYIAAEDEIQVPPLIIDQVGDYLPDTCWVFNYEENAWSQWRLPMTGFGYDVLTPVQTIESLSGTIEEQDWRYDEKRLQESSPSNLLAQCDGRIYEIADEYERDWADTQNYSIVTYWESKDFDFDQPTQDKTFARLIIFHPTDSSPITVRVGISTDSGETWIENDVVIRAGFTETFADFFRTGPQARFRLRTENAGLYVNGFAVKVIPRGEINPY